MDLSKNSDILQPMAALNWQSQKCFVKTVWIEPIGDKCGDSSVLEGILRFLGTVGINSFLFEKD